MSTVGQLRRTADEALLGGDFAAALHRYTLALRAQPRFLDARLRVADALLALGEVQRAAQVYAVYAEHAAQAGHPLRALVALKVLAALEPQLGALVHRVAARYALGSPHLGRSARPSPWDPDAPLPDGLAALAAAPAPPLARLVAAAEELAVDPGGLPPPPERVPPVPLLSLLPTEAFAAVLEAVRLVRCRPGAVVITQGAPGDAFYLLARGRVAVDRAIPNGPTERLATLSEGAIFGEMALLSAAPRTATVTALEDTDLLELGREALAAAADQLDTLAQALDRFTRERLVENVLRTSPLFRPLDEAGRRALFARFSSHHLGPGEVVVTEGAPVPGLFVVLSGEVSVTKDDAGAPVPLATLGPGELFGELSLVLGGPATATVTTTCATALLFLERDVVTRLIAAVPAIAAYVEGLAEQRQLDTEALLGVELAVD